MYASSSVYFFPPFLFYWFHLEKLFRLSCFIKIESFHIRTFGFWSVSEKYRFQLLLKAKTVFRFKYVGSFLVSVNHNDTLCITSNSSGDPDGLIRIYPLPPYHKIGSKKWPWKKFLTFFTKSSVFNPKI